MPVPDSPPETPSRRPESCARRRLCWLSGPSIAVLEPHDVLQLGRAHLEDLAVGQGLHAVPRARRQVHRLAGLEGPLLMARGLTGQEEVERPTVEVEALLLALVVLETQGFARPDDQDFPRILPRAREQDLLAPRLRNMRDAHGLTSTTGLASLGTMASTVRFASSSIDSAESSLRASSTRARASARLSARMTCFTDGMAAGFMLSSVIPSPTRMTAATGFDAISPHTETRRPVRAAASTTRRTRCRIAGCSGWERYDTDSLPRSMARAYWIRSLVPMEKKSTSRARRSAISAAAGTSIITPSGTSGSHGMCCARSSWRTSSTMARARRSSSMPVTIGKSIDRKSTRLNSSHLVISYAVFCLKKKIGLVRER